MKRKRLIVFIFAFLFVITAVFLGRTLFLKSYSLEYDEWYIDDETQQLKLLVIDIDPILYSITDTTKYPNNSGHPTVTELFGYSPQVSTSEMIADFERGTNNYIDVVDTWEYLNEFPTYKIPAVLSDGTVLTEEFSYNGTTHYKMTENMYLKYARGSNGVYSWWNLYNNGIFGSDSGINILSQTFAFDYKYILDKFDLINRKNNGEFDQVWIVGMDPSFAYETMMVGRQPFWINGTPYVADCDNFIIGFFSTARRDSQLHALSHSMEHIMRAAFNRYYNTSSSLNGYDYKIYHASYESYAKDSINVSSLEQFNNLNLWEQFVLNDWANANEGEYTSVGNIHYPFNADKDYDYKNTRYVRTNCIEWLDYNPALGVSTIFSDTNSEAWLGGNYSLLSLEHNQSGDRFHTKWWLSLIPYRQGYSYDGHYNNWWKYFLSLDFVSRMTELNTTNIIVKKGEYVPVNLKLTFNSNKQYTLTKLKQDNNIMFMNSNILGFKDGYVYGKEVGKTKLRVAYDGKYIIYDVEVSDDFIPVESIEFNESILVVKKNYSIKLGYNITPSDATNKQLIFTSSNESVVGIDSENAYIDAWAPGRATITVTTIDGGFTDTIDIIVDEKIQPKQIFSLPFARLKSNERIKLDYINNSDSSDSVQFVSSDESIATVDSSGNVTGLKTGVAKISILSSDGQVQNTINVYIGDVKVLDSNIYNVSLEKSIVELPSMVDSRTFNNNVFSDFTVDYDSSPYIGTGKDIRIISENDIIETYKALVYGDVNGDGKLLLNDVMKIAKYIYKDDNLLKGLYLKAADYNQDNKYELDDIMELVPQVYVVNEKPEVH